MSLSLRLDHGFLRVAHRGAASLAPENTIAALEAALAHGVDLVELDVVRADGRLLVAHSLAELGPANPSLDEALAFFAERSRPEIGIDLDLKGWGFEEEVVEGLRRHGLVERALVSSFFVRALTSVRRAEPGLPTGLSYPYDRYRVERRVPDVAVRSALAGIRRVLPRRIAGMLRRADANAAMIHHLAVSQALVERCHALGAAVFAWTVDDAVHLERVLAVGVDGVITNEPRIFSSAR